MIKTFAAAAVIGVITANSAIAGPYVNAELNSGFAGSDYVGSVTELAVGYEGGNDSATGYIQAGPAFVSVDGEDLETELSGKIGGNLAVSENIGVYGELAFITSDDDNAYGAKAGVKYTF